MEKPQRLRLFNNSVFLFWHDPHLSLEAVNVRLFALTFPLRSHLKNGDILMFVCFVHFSLYRFNFRSRRSCLKNNNSTVLRLVSELYLSTVQWQVSHVITTCLFANSEIIQRLSILRVKDTILSAKKSDRATEFYQSCSTSNGTFQFSFAESSCCKWQSVDEAGGDQVNRGRLRGVLCWCSTSRMHCSPIKHPL